MDWTAFLSPAERQRLETLNAELKTLQRERDRLRIRATGRRENATIRQRRAEGDADRVVL